MVTERGMAMHRLPAERLLQFFLIRNVGAAHRRREFLERLTVERMHGHINPEALLGALDEFLAAARIARPASS